MLTQILVVLVILALFALWLRSARGRSALALVLRARGTLLVALVLWGLLWALWELDLGALDEPFLVLDEIGFFISVTTVLMAALHTVASALVVAALGRAALGRAATGAPLTWTRVLPGVFLGSAAVWAVMLGFLRILVALRVGSTGVMLLLVIVMALLIVALNLLLARLVARLVASRGRVRPALERLWKADPDRDAPMLSTVLLRLVLTGALVPIWILGHTSTSVRVEHTQDGNETTTSTTRSTTTRDATKLAVDTQTVASLTCSNPWPDEIGQAVKSEVSILVGRAFGLLSALLSVLFLAAIVGERRASPPMAAPA